MHTVPFAKPDITELEIDAVAQCMRSGWLTSGGVVNDFESQFARYVKAPHAIATSSATTAALILMQAAGVGPGTSVVFPTYTFSGPAMMAHHLGAEVILVDSAKDDFVPRVGVILDAVREDTKAVFLTHYAGDPLRWEYLQDLKSKLPPGVFLFDDAAHAFPSRYNNTGLPVGAEDVTDGTIFSFYATKCLTTGEGGMLTTPHRDIAEETRALRLHGFDRAVYDRHTNPKTGWDYNVGYAGWKANMPDTAAAMGIVQLSRSKEMLRKRTDIAMQYEEAFIDDPCVEALPDIGREATRVHSAHLYPLVLKREQHAMFIASMREQGIQCSTHFKPLHQHSMYKNILSGTGVAKSFSNADSMFLKEVSLPIYSSMTCEDVEAVILAAKRTLKSMK